MGFLRRTPSRRRREASRRFQNRVQSNTRKKRAHRKKLSDRAARTTGSWERVAAILGTLGVIATLGGLTLAYRNAKELDATRSQHAQVTGEIQRQHEQATEELRSQHEQATEELRSQRDAYQQELLDLRERVAELDSQWIRVQAENESLLASNEELKRALDQRNNRITELNGELEKVAEDLDETMRRFEASEEAMKQSRVTLLGIACRGIADITGLEVEDLTQRLGAEEHKAGELVNEMIQGLREKASTQDINIGELQEKTDELVERNRRHCDELEAAKQRTAELETELAQQTDKFSREIDAMEGVVRDKEAAEAAVAALKFDNDSLRQQIAAKDKEATVLHQQTQKALQRVSELAKEVVALNLAATEADAKMAQAQSAVRQQKDEHQQAYEEDRRALRVRFNVLSGKEADARAYIDRLGKENKALVAERTSLTAALTLHEADNKRLTTEIAAQQQQAASTELELAEMRAHLAETTEVMISMQEVFHALGERVVGESIAPILSEDGSAAVGHTEDVGLGSIEHLNDELDDLRRKNAESTTHEEAEFLREQMQGLSAENDRLRLEMQELSHPVPMAQIIEELPDRFLAATGAPTGDELAARTEKLTVLYDVIQSLSSTVSIGSGTARKLDQDRGYVEEIKRLTGEIENLTRERGEREEAALVERAFYSAMSNGLKQRLATERTEAAQEADRTIEARTAELEANVQSLKKINSDLERAKASLESDKKGLESDKEGLESDKRALEANQDARREITSSMVDRVGKLSRGVGGWNVDIPVPRDTDQQSLWEYQATSFITALAVLGTAQVAAVENEAAAEERLRETKRQLATSQTELKAARDALRDPTERLKIDSLELKVRDLEAQLAVAVRVKQEQYKLGVKAGDFHQSLVAFKTAHDLEAPLSTHEELINRRLGDAEQVAVAASVAQASFGNSNASTRRPELPAFKMMSGGVGGALEWLPREGGSRKAERESVMLARQRAELGTVAQREWATSLHGLGSAVSSYDDEDPRAGSVTARAGTRGDKDMLELIARMEQGEAYQ